MLILYICEISTIQAILYTIRLIKIQEIWQKNVRIYWTRLLLTTKLHTGQQTEVLSIKASKYLS